MSVTGTLTNLRKNEPVRLYAYPTLILLVGYLVVSGYVDSNLANIALGILGAALGVPFAEVARNKVYPEAKVRDVIDSAADAALTGARETVQENFGPQGVEVLDQVRDYIGKHRRPE